MKNTFKVCAIAGGVLLTAGLVISLVSLRVNGVAGSLRQLTDGSGGSSAVQLMDADAVKIQEDVTSLDISLPGAELTVEIGDAFSLSMGSVVKKYATVSVDGGTLSIKAPDNRRDRWWNRNRPGELAVNLTLPRRAYREVSISLGAGDGRVTGLEADSLTVDFGAGTLDLNGVTLKKADVSGGAGEIKAAGLTVTERFTFDAGVGESRIDGDLAGDIEITGGVGSTRLDLAGARRDYNIEASAGIGDVKIDGEHIRFFERDFEEDKAAENDLSVTCGVGEIEINFGG